MTSQYGYCGKILRVDLSSGKITETPTMDYADRFLGGIGVAAKIFWDEVPPETGAFDPENRLMFMNGPLAGFTGISGSRWVVCGKSPTTTPEHFATSNLGGRWGAQLKFAGYDGIVVQGKSDKPVYLCVEDDVVQIRGASHLWGKGAVETRMILKGELGEKVAVAACGPAGENRVVFSSILADNDASGSSGLGAVMGSKNLKAIAVRGSGNVVAANPERLKELVKYFRELWKGLRILMDKRAEMGKQKKDPCYGCMGSACTRGYRELEDGSGHKSFCIPPAVFYMFAFMHYGDMNNPPARDVPVLATRMLDDYGLDAHGVVNLMALLAMGGQAGIVTEESTGLPLSKLGSLEFTETLMKKISFREGFGDVMAQGIWRTADIVGKGAKDLLANFPVVAVGQDGRIAPYCPRAFPAHGLLYATEPTLRIQQLHEMSFVHFRWLPSTDENFIKESFLAGLEGPIVSSDLFRKIAKRFWGSEMAADFSTYEGKALAAKKIQDRSDVKESLILCDELWPVLTVATGDHAGDPTLESKIFSAVTGKEVDEEGLYFAGERIFNLRRAITLRERGKGREKDTLPEYMFTAGLIEGTENPTCLAPGKDGEIISLKGTVVDREKFEKMKDEYYKLRGWDVATGLQTRTKLEELGLQDIAKGLEQKELLAEAGAARK